MLIKVIDFGYKKLPERGHYNDAGADVRVCMHNKDSITIWPHTTEAIPLGYGLEIPDGYMACVFPRSGLSKNGIVCELPPIDSGYRGEIHAIVHNGSNVKQQFKNGERIGQLVILPVIMAEFVTDLGDDRGNGAFGSTGLK